VVSLERGQEVGTHAGSGTVLGALAGIAAGGGVLAYIGGGCEDTGCLGWMLLAPYAIGGGAVVGGIVGRLIGRSVPRIEWRGVALPVRVGVGPSRDGGLRMRFTLR